MTKEEIVAERERLQNRIKRARGVLYYREEALKKLQRQICKHPGVKWKPGFRRATFSCPYCELYETDSNN